VGVEGVSDGVGDVVVGVDGTEVGGLVGLVAVGVVVGVGFVVTGGFGFTLW